MSSPEQKDIAWGVHKTPLHLALMEGRLLDARKLLVQGHWPDEETLTLAFKQDRLATHALLREMGLDTTLLPGSRLAKALDACQAEALADSMLARIPWADEQMDGKEKGAHRARL